MLRRLRGRILLVGASHGIGHQLGPLGVGHSETSCILLPAVLSYNARANSEKQEKVKNIIWSDETVVQVLKKAGLEKDESNAGDALDAEGRRSRQRQAGYPDREQFARSLLCR